MGHGIRRGPSDSAEKVCRIAIEDAGPFLEIYGTHPQ